MFCYLVSVSSGNDWHHGVSTVAIGGREMRNSESQEKPKTMGETGEVWMLFIFALVLNLLLFGAVYVGRWIATMQGWIT